VEQQLLSHLPPEVQHKLEQARSKAPPATPAQLLSAQLAGPRVSMQRWVVSCYVCCYVTHGCNAPRCVHLLLNTEHANRFAGCNNRSAAAHTHTSRVFDCCAVLCCHGVVCMLAGTALQRNGLKSQPA
jgi:hypothetical protein